MVGEHSKVGAQGLKEYWARVALICSQSQHAEAEAFPKNQDDWSPGNVLA